MGGLVAVAPITITLGAAHDDSRPGTVIGYVLNSAYFFVRKTNKPLNAGKCALECARAGPPLAILTSNGADYWLISDAIPATAQNARLMEFDAAQVAARGKLIKRGGSHANAIETIEEVSEGN